MAKLRDMRGIQSRYFFAITENALEDFYILVGIIHSKKGENDAENGDYCQSIPLSG